MTERLGIISDIHGNLAALDAVLSVLTELGADRHVCLGDIAASGPSPAEVVERVAELNCPIVMGNADMWLLDPPPPPDIGFERQLYEIDQWCLDRLGESELEFIRSFQETIELELDGRRTMLCFHGTPRSRDESVYAWDSKERFDEALGDVKVDVFAGGHTHFPFLRRHRTSTFVNPGSVGLAYDRTHPENDILIAPWAECALLTSDSGDIDVRLLRVAYDDEKEVAAARAKGMPHVADWAGPWRGR